jgi:hypothetical protein
MAKRSIVCSEGKKPVTDEGSIKIRRRESKTGKEKRK